VLAVTYKHLILGEAEQRLLATYKLAELPVDKAEDHFQTSCNDDLKVVFPMHTPAE
jgi:hypothetical protein